VALQTLEVSKRRGSLALPGFFVGLGVGAVWAAHWATHTSNPFTPFEGTYGDNAGGILLRVGAGGLAGAIAGSLIHFEKWTAVPLGELRIDLRPRPGSQLGFGALLTL
jgi:hypothetical protein